MAPPQPKKRIGAPTPPPQATHWMISSIQTSGGRTRTKVLTGPPQSDGSVPDVWGVAEFSPSGVLNLWGEGKYRVEWYGSDQERLGGELFEVAKPKKAGSPKLAAAKRRRAAVDDDDEDPEVADPGGGGGMGFMQIMALLDRNTERAERREEAKSERDRAFFMQMQQTQTALLTAIMGRPASPLGAESLQVLEQRLGLQIDQAMFRLEKKLATQPADEPDDDGDDGDEPPADIAEAAERMVMSWLGKVEANPELMGEFLPKILSFLKGQGVQPSDELQARIDAARAAASNGRAHA
jgi:hypothetical protein